MIAATGFVAPLLDLPELGVATFGQSRLPAQTPYWESASVPGIYFAGTISQGAGGLKKHGLPANSGAVHGARYNARVLARHIAATRFGAPAALERPRIAPDELVDTLVEPALGAPELWHQKAYLARVVSLDPADGAARRGHRAARGVRRCRRGRRRRDAVALTLEADGTGAIYPVVYVRRDGAGGAHVRARHPAAV